MPTCDSIQAISKAREASKPPSTSRRFTRVRAPVIRSSSSQDLGVMGLWQVKRS
jgi:hypothetical protein